MSKVAQFSWLEFNTVLQVMAFYIISKQICHYRTPGIAVLTARAWGGGLNEGHLTATFGVFGPHIQAVLGGVDQSVYVRIISPWVRQIGDLLLQIAQVQSTHWNKLTTDMTIYTVIETHINLHW